MSGKTPTVRIFFITVSFIAAISVIYYVYSNTDFFQPDNPKPSSREKLISEIGTSEYIFDGTRILDDSGAQIDHCTDSLYCIRFKNNSNAWVGILNGNTAVKLAENNLIKLSFRSSDGKAGINLLGNLSASPDEWWIDRNGINFYFAADRLEINADSGIDRKTVGIYNEKFSGDENGFFTFFLLVDKYGKNISLIDNKGGLIKNFKYSSFDLNKKFRGFFHDGKMYLGITAEPHAELKINYFYGRPISESNKS